MPALSVGERGAEGFVLSRSHFEGVIGGLRDSFHHVLLLHGFHPTSLCANDLPFAVVTTHLPRIAHGLSNCFPIQ